jgi:DNA-directed RNA polymerase subunit L
MEHMELEILKSSKEEIEVRLGNMTLVEILRVYLNKDSAVSFAAWKREHPSEKPILKVVTKGKTAKKAINDAVNAITKDLDKIEEDFKKMK